MTFMVNSIYNNAYLHTYALSQQTNAYLHTYAVLNFLNVCFSPDSNHRHHYATDVFLS